jgi:hypothetical protein
MVLTKREFSLAVQTSMMRSTSSRSFSVNSHETALQFLIQARFTTRG